MKKKKKSVADILARAEKLFQRGNFPLAQKEFEKAQKELNREDIAGKIEICRKEAGALKAKELIKRARKAEKTGHLNNALSCFEQAASIFSEAWIITKIDRLKAQLTSRNAVLAAREAEAAGAFQKAADWYVCADPDGETGNFLLKRARCLVKAEKYTEAVAAFKTLSPTDSGGRYDYGLALAKTGRFRAGLKVWDGLDTTAGVFAEQNRTVCRCLAADLYDRFEEKGDHAAIYRDAHYLLNLVDHGLKKNQIRSLEDLLEYCKYDCIKELWEAEEFETITGFLETAPIKMTPSLLDLNAKIWFKLAAIDGKHLNTMIPFWLTAVFSGQVTAGLDAEEGTREKVRRKLIDAAENLIKENADNENGRLALIYLEIEKELIQELCLLVDGQENRAHQVCTPLHAFRSGKSDDILSLIRENRAFFRNTQHYLETGAYYSVTGQSLYLIKSHEPEKAMNFLAALPPETRSDEFSDYATKRVHFEYAMDCIENGESRFIRYFKAAPALFEMVPAYEENFTEKALQVEDLSALKTYEEALVYIHAQRPSKGNRQTLSLVMTQRAIALCNKGQMSRKALKATTNKALQLYPENELARGALRSAMIDLEGQEIDQAFQRHKLSKASRIARETEFPEVQDQYFEIVESLFEKLQKTDLPRDEKMMILNEVYESADTVDWKHPVLAKIRIFLSLRSERIYE